MREGNKTQEEEEEEGQEETPRPCMACQFSIIINSNKLIFRQIPRVDEAVLAHESHCSVECPVFVFVTIIIITTDGHKSSQPQWYAEWEIIGPH